MPANGILTDRTGTSASCARNGAILFTVQHCSPRVEKSKYRLGRIGAPLNSYLSTWAAISPSRVRPDGATAPPASTWRAPAFAP
ncbi:hypothetical protein D3C78_1779570 [compost metagenome]